MRKIVNLGRKYDVMASFKEFVEQQEFVDFIIEHVEKDEIDSIEPTHQFNLDSPGKPWSATKDQIMQMWRNLRPDVPINLTPIDTSDPEGNTKTYGEDGIRITGTWNFIASVMGRLKDIMVFENPQTKLRLVFRGVDSTRDARPDRQSYVFYVNLERRSHGKAGRPKKGEVRLHTER